MDKHLYLRKIPKVNDLLESEEGKKLITEYSHQLLVDAIRKVTDDIRDEILNGDGKELKESDIDITKNAIMNRAAKYLELKLSPNLKTVINATGVVVHTNLGRSLLSESAREALAAVAGNYSTLEIDRDSGERGSRYDNVKDILNELTGAEASMVVNNNAGAVLLALRSIAEKKEVIIARGELVEIGGSFRVPDVMNMSGAELVEIGTTNKVYISDYKKAITEETGLLLKVHTSNYKIVGFSEEVVLEELVNLGADKSLPVMVDLGSGIMVDLTPEGLSYEPTVQDNIKAGADIVTISGDKLLGGPQAGIILGKKQYINKMKEHPLNRALRVDKFTLAALEATLKEYLDLNKVKKEIPTLRMITVSSDELKLRAEKLFKELQKELTAEFNINLQKDHSRVGGGAYPLEQLPTYVIGLSHNKFSEETLARKLRMNNPPIFSRIQNNEVLLDMRTLKDDDIASLIAGIKNI